MKRPNLTVAIFIVLAVALAPLPFVLFEDRIAPHFPWGAFWACASATTTLFLVLRLRYLRRRAQIQVKHA